MIMAAKTITYAGTPGAEVQQVLLHRSSGTLVMRWGPARPWVLPTDMAITALSAADALGGEATPPYVRFDMFGDRPPKLARTPVVCANAHRSHLLGNSERKVQSKLARECVMILVLDVL